MKTISHDVCEKRIKKDVYYLDLIRDFISIGENRIIQREEEKMTIKKTKKIDLAFPPTPFLLIDVNKEECDKYRVVESWKETDIHALRECHFMQKIEFKTHKPSDEELEEYLSEEKREEAK